MICPGVITLKIFHEQDKPVTWTSSKNQTFCTITHSLFHPLIPPLYDYNNIIWGDKNNTKLMNDPELENWKLRTNESSRTCLFFVPGFAPRLRQTFLATNIIANQCFIVNTVCRQR